MKPTLLLSSLPAFLPAVLAATAGQQWNVDVGLNGNLTYSPPFVNAKVGDIVVFTFHPKNHTVTQSSFDEPCVPIPGGFDTAFNNPVSDESVNPKPTYQVTVNTMDPVWIFCRQTGHCGKGMVFAINPPASGDHTFDAFQARAIQINGTASGTPPPPPASTDDGSNGGGYNGGSYTTLPPEPWQSATATLSNSETTYVTTYTSYIGSPAPSYAPSGPVDHKIIVGFNGTLTFNPANLQAAVGDRVIFEFHPKNHTATFSTFDNPCVPKPGGWDSGFMPVSPDQTDFPTATITINDTTPIWGFCRQPGPPNHCASGMVFSINSVESSEYNWTAFQGAAQALGGLASNGSGSDGSDDQPSGGKGNGALGSRSGMGLIMAFAALVGGLVIL